MRLRVCKGPALAGLSFQRAVGGMDGLEPRGQLFRHDRRRIKELERELRRKDKALAETSALLVLSRKVAAIFNKGEDE